jgi:hypothetical protein
MRALAPELGDLLLQLRDPTLAAGELFKRSVDLGVGVQALLLLLLPEPLDFLVERIPLRSQFVADVRKLAYKAISLFTVVATKPTLECGRWHRCKLLPQLMKLKLGLFTISRA